MRTGRPHRVWRPRWLFVAVVIALLASGTAAADRTRPTLREARSAAREAVRKHPTYRSIRSEAPLVTQSCRRARRAVRCSLYRWAPDPCALDGRDGPCVQVLTRRIWLVAVKRRRGRTVARILRVTDSSSSPAYSASLRSSS